MNILFCLSAHSNSGESFFIFVANVPSIRVFVWLYCIRTPMDTRHLHSFLICFGQVGFYRVCLIWDYHDNMPGGEEHPRIQSSFLVEFFFFFSRSQYGVIDVYPMTNE